MNVIIQNLSKRYLNGNLALENINLTLKHGDFACLTGHSGAGKSTLLKLIAAIEFSEQGQITVGSFNLNRLKKREIPFLRRKIGIILQTPNLLNDRTVFENVALPLIITGSSLREIQSRVRAVLAKLSLQHHDQSLPEELSSGEQQRVAIARAIVNKPSLLLADEPTGNLDPALSKEIMHLFQQFSQLGMTTLIATHDMNLIQSLNCRIISLNQGKLC